MSENLEGPPHLEAGTPAAPLPRPGTALKGFGERGSPRGWIAMPGHNGVHLLVNLRRDSVGALPRLWGCWTRGRPEVWKGL